MSYDCFKSLPPADKELVEKYVNSIKSKGIFDQFRKECQADVDTKPAYQNLQQRVENTVSKFLSTYKWQENLNKTQIRERLRKYVQQDYLENGVDRIVDQVVNPKIYSVFMPKVGDIIYESLGIERPKQAIESIKPPSMLLHNLPSATVESVAVLPIETRMSAEGTVDEFQEKERTPERVVSDLQPHDDLDPVSPGDSLVDNMEENSNTVTNDETGVIQVEPGTPEKEAKETNDGDVEEDEDDEEDASPAFEPIITSKDSKMSGGGLSEVSREEGTVFSDLNEPTNEKKFDNFSNLDEKIKQCEVNLTEMKPDDEPSNSSDTKTEDTVKDEPIKEEKEEPVKVISEDSASSQGCGSLKKHETSSSNRKSDSSRSEKKSHDSRRDKGKSSGSSSRHKSSSSSRHHSSSKDRKDDQKSSRSSSKSERKDDKKEDRQDEKKEDKKEEKRTEKKVDKRDEKKDDRKDLDRKDEKKEERKDDRKEDRRDKKDDRSEKRKDSESKSSSRQHEKKSDSRHSSSSRSSDKKSQSSADKSKETKDKEDEERKREAKKRKGERCDDVKSKNPRRSSDRDNNGGQGSSKSNKTTSSSSSSSRKSSSSTSNTDKSEGTKDKSTEGDDQQEDDSPVDKTDEVDLILMQINSQIERDEQQMLNCKKPKIANNFKEMKKVMKARKMLENSRRLIVTEENKENDDSENRPKQTEEDFKENPLTEMAVVQTLSENGISAQDNLGECSPSDEVETSSDANKVPILPIDDISQSSLSDSATCSSREPFLGFEIDSDESDVETNCYKKHIDDIMRGKKKCFISLAKIQSPLRIEDERTPAIPLVESIAPSVGRTVHAKKEDNLISPEIVDTLVSEDEKTFQLDAGNMEEAKKKTLRKTSINSETVKDENAGDTNSDKELPSQGVRKLKKQVPAKSIKHTMEKNKIDPKVTLKVKATLTMQKDRLISESVSVGDAEEARDSSASSSVMTVASEEISKRKSAENSSDNEENLSKSQVGAFKPPKKQKKGVARPQAEITNLDNSNNNGGSLDKNKLEQTKRSSQRYDNEDLYKPRPVLSHHNSRRFRAANADASGSAAPQVPLLGLRQRNRDR